MSHFRPHHLILTVFAVSAIALNGCDKSVSIPAVNEMEIPTPDIDVEEYTEQIKELYERAKAAGEQVPEDIYDWAKSDVKKIGTWDYKIVSFSPSAESEADLLKTLKSLGEDRWECFWVEKTPTGKRFYFKKSVRSYLQVAGKATPFVPIPGKGE